MTNNTRAAWTAPTVTNACRSLKKVKSACAMNVKPRKQTMHQKLTKADLQPTGRKTPAEHTAEFLAAVKPFPAPVVAKAMTNITLGINWAKCSKSHMAESYGRDRLNAGATHAQLAVLQLDRLVAECKKISK